MDTIEKLRFKQALAILMIAKAERLSLYYNSEFKDQGFCSYMGGIIYDFIEDSIVAKVETEAPEVYLIMKNSMLNRAFKSWDIYSGDLSFPIPSLHAFHDAKERYQRADYLWDDSGYATLRRELAMHCAIRFRHTLHRIETAIANLQSKES
jgi:hypothetical protein